MKYQAGNALFLILIAVALFAALSYAITQSGRGSGNIKKEELTLGANRLIQYVAMLRHEVHKMRILNDCKVENMDWRNSHWKRLDGNPSVGILHGPMVPKSGCALFSDYGGPVSPNIDFEDLAQPDYNATGPTYFVKGGHAVINYADKAGAGTEETDVVIEFRGLEPFVCSYLLDRNTMPDLFHEERASTMAFNSPPPDYTTSDDIIDEPLNAGEFYIHAGISTGTGCDAGAVIFER